MDIIVKSSQWKESDIQLVFGGFKEEAIDITYVDDVDISQLLSDLKIYKSRSQARQANRHGPIPKGYTEYKASKKVMLYIWNPYD